MYVSDFKFFSPVKETQVFRFVTELYLQQTQLDMPLKVSVSLYQDFYLSMYVQKSILYSLTIYISKFFFFLFLRGAGNQL